MKPTLFLAAAMAVAFCGTAGAERPSEDPEKADCVVTGTVQRVFVRQAGRHHEYLVELRVETVHAAPRDDDQGAHPVKPGGRVVAYCFRTDPAPTPVSEARGHDGVPKEGERVKAYLRWRREFYEGNYPHWFDAAPKDASK